MEITKKHLVDAIHNNLSRLFTSRSIDKQNDKRNTMTLVEEGLFGIDKLNVSHSSVPIITHVNYYARIQMSHADTTHRYHDVISKFKEKTSCPLIVNTSYNIHGETMICTPKRCI